MTHPFTDPVHAARWLQTQLTHLATNPDAEQIYTELTAAIAHAHRVIDRPPAWRYLGDCPGCREDLHALEDADHVTCTHCSWTGQVADILDRVIHDHEDRLFTDSELVGALVQLSGQTVTRNQINGWARRGRLAVHEQKRWWNGEIRTVRAFRLGDVLHLAQQASAS